MIDIIYPYILPYSGDNGDELKFSLRSLEKCFSDFKIWIVGEKPNWIKNVEFISSKKKCNAWKDVNCKVNTILNIDSIGKNFILMNDDIYFANHLTFDYLSKLRASKELTDNTLWDINTRGRESFLALNNAYVKIKMKFKNIATLSIWDYESHLPRVFNKSLLIDVYKEYDLCNNQISIPTLYFNYYHPDTTPEIVKDYIVSNDVVLRFKSKTNYDLKTLKLLVSNKKIISNSAPGFNKAKKLLEDLFSNKSSYEQ